MTMQHLNTIGGLIEALEDLAATYGADCEVAVAMQESWPLAARIANLRHHAEFANDRDDDVAAADGAKAPTLLWIAVETAEVNGSPYAPREAWEESGTW
jgi:hypothetical protein